MTVVKVIRYTTTPESADENARLVGAVYAELAREKPPGLRYATFRLDDGVSFLHVALLDAEENPLTTSAAFAAFQSAMADRLAEGPVQADATVVGSYELSDATTRPSRPATQNDAMSSGSSNPPRRRRPASADGPTVSCGRRAEARRGRRRRRRGADASTVAPPDACNAAATAASRSSRWPITSSMASAGSTRRDPWPGAMVARGGSSSSRRRRLPRYCAMSPSRGAMTTVDPPMM